MKKKPEACNLPACTTCGRPVIKKGEECNICYLRSLYAYAGLGEPHAYISNRWDIEL